MNTRITRHSGPDGSRTRDLLDAIEALSQLSYQPETILWTRRESNPPGTGANGSRPLGTCAPMAPLRPGLPTART